MIHNFIYAFEKKNFNKIYSVRNPPPICFDIPYIKEAASICLKFTDLEYINKTISGCVELLITLADIDLVRLLIKIWILK